MIRWVLRLYPPDFRRRFGSEIADAVASSAQPIRDLADVTVHAARLRGEQLMVNRVRHAANAAVLIAVFLLGYAVNDVQGGLADVHRHWWSTAAVAFVVLALAARVAVEWSTGRRSDAPRRS